MRSKRARAQTRHIRRSWAGRGPVKAAVLLRNRDIVDAGLAPAHQAVLVELPLLIAVGAVPLPGIVMPFVLKTHGDAVAVECPEILDQAVVKFSRPFAGEKSDDRGAALEKFGAVAPAAVLGIGQRHALGIARIPGVFRHAGLLGGGFSGEWWKRRARHDDSLKGLMWPGLYRGDPSCRWRIAYRPIAKLYQPSSVAAAISESAAPGPR